MAKLSDLGLPEASGPGGGDPLRVNQQQVDKFLDHVEAMIHQVRYRFAYDTLEGIKGMVEATNRVTENQRRAVQNIEVGAERADSAREDRSRRRHRWDP